MDSPKRKAQKNKDYRRHRMMRLLNRRKATAQEAMSEIAERELMRKLRITPLKKFEDGKGPKMSIDDFMKTTASQTLNNLTFDVKGLNEEPEVLRPKPVEPVEPKRKMLPVNEFYLKPMPQISELKFAQSHPLYKEEYDYLQSDAFFKRANKMAGGDRTKAAQIVNSVRDGFRRTYLPSRPRPTYISRSYNQPYNYGEDGVPLRYIYWGEFNDFPAGYDTIKGTLAHELAHSLYEAGRTYGDPFGDYGTIGRIHTEYLFSPEYQQKLTKGFRHSDVDDETRAHDNTNFEKIADIRGLLQLAKDANVWDKTTGEDMTPEMYQKLKQKYPDHRSFDMWNDEDLRWLINTTAQNVAPSNNIQYRAYLGKKPGYKMPVHTPLYA